MSTHTLNALLKMAVLAGVETAVRQHIRRGDDLDARDSGGCTPLMLAASRNKADICRLLLAAGVKHDLADTSGRNAIAIAYAAGASEAVAVIENYIATTSNVINAVEKIGLPHRSDLILDFSDDEENSLDLSDWDVEEDNPPPAEDETLAKSATVLLMAIARHRPVDTAEDWKYFDLFLPDSAAPLLQADDEDGRIGLRYLFLRALKGRQRTRNSSSEPLR